MEIQGPIELERYGMLPGVDSPHCLIDHIDPIAGFEPRVDDYGQLIPEPVTYLTEDETGIAIWRHPEAMLRDHPRLWGPVGAWRSGVSTALSLSEYRSAPSYWVQCFAVMRGAQRREQAREDIRRREAENG